MFQNVVMARPIQEHKFPDPTFILPNTIKEVDKINAITTSPVQVCNFDIQLEQCSDGLDLNMVRLLPD